MIFFAFPKNIHEKGLARLFHESEAFIGKAFQGLAIFRYAEP
jgi:hypothetical protein